MNTLTLRDLKPGETGLISNISGEGALKKRLLEMGLTKGKEVKVIKVAPLGDPIEIQIRGYELSLRKKEAELILITKK